MFCFTQNEWLCMFAVIALAFALADGCTLIACGPKSTLDGSSLIAHTDDAGVGASDLRLINVPAQHHPPHALRSVYKFLDGYPRVVTRERGPHYTPKGSENVFVPLGHIPQVAYTHGYFDQSYGMMNDVQLSIGESTCGARTAGWSKDLSYGRNLFSIDELSRIALERCDTAPCAIKLMGSLAEEHGFYSDGSGDLMAPNYVETAESLGISDKYGQVWIFHILTGKNHAGAVWAAQRLADDHVTAVANAFVIRELDLSDPDRFLASSNVFSFAEEMKWWDKASGEAFDFTKAYGYHSTSPVLAFYTGRRIWRIFDVLAPSLQLDSRLGHYSRIKTYPFSVRPDKLVGLNDLMNLLRDYYQGTPYDLSRGLAAGPFAAPVRWDSSSRSPQGGWERPISIYRATYSFVLQSRSHLPDAVGGIIWYGQGSPHGTIYVPFSCCQESVPDSYLIGIQSKFDMRSAWRAFNFVNNWSLLRYDSISRDVQSEILILQTAAFKMQQTFDLEYVNKSNDTELACQVRRNAFASHIVSEWWALAWRIVAKYSDGYILTGEGPHDLQLPGYPKWWLESTSFVHWPTETIAFNKKGETTSAPIYVREEGRPLHSLVPESMAYAQVCAGLVIGIAIGIVSVKAVAYVRHQNYITIV